MEQTVSFTSHGETLVGILHLQEGTAVASGDGIGAQPESQPGIVFVHSGSRGRLGNTFHYPFMARALAQEGYPVLRFDPRGIGDSTATIETCSMNDFYGTIQMGRFVDDTLAAIEEMQRRVGRRPIILFGICGGAITALLTGAQSSSVSGLVLLSVPVLVDFSQQSDLDRIPSQFAWRYLVGMYRHKIFSLRSWHRLLTRKSETGRIKTYAVAALRGILPGRSAERGGSKQESEKKAKRCIRFNDLFIKALDAYCRHERRVVFMFGEEDAFRWEFDREFLNGGYWDSNPRFSQHCTIHYIAACNHMFTLREWQIQAIGHLLPWLRSLAAQASTR